jgi:hypothetical protein
MGNPQVGRRQRRRVTMLASQSLLLSNAGVFGGGRSAAAFY